MFLKLVYYLTTIISSLFVDGDIAGIKGESHHKLPTNHTITRTINTNHVNKSNNITFKDFLVYSQNNTSSKLTKEINKNNLKGEESKEIDEMLYENLLENTENFQNEINNLTENNNTLNEQGCSTEAIKRKRQMSWLRRT